MSAQPIHSEQLFKQFYFRNHSGYYLYNRGAENNGLKLKYNVHHSVKTSTLFVWGETSKRLHFCEEKEGNNNSFRRQRCRTIHPAKMLNDAMKDWKAFSCLISGYNTWQRLATKYETIEVPFHSNPQYSYFQCDSIPETTELKLPLMKPLTRFFEWKMVTSSTRKTLGAFSSGA